MWLRLPLRSLVRNRRRTGLSLGIIALGTALSFVVGGFFGSSSEVIKETTVAEYGNLQIATQALWNGESGAATLIPEERVTRLRALLEREPEVASSSAQLSFSGLAVVGRASRVVKGTALVPGNATLDYNDLVAEGRGLLPTDRGHMLVGRTLADELSLKVGDAITLTATTLDGAYNVSPVEVVGIYRFTSSEFELRQVFVPLEFGQALLNTQGVDKLVVRLSDIKATDGVAASLRRALQKEGLALVPRTWDDLAGFYRQLKGLFDLLATFITLVVGVLVFVIILQVLTMSFLERTREVGTIRALGTRRSEVFRFFLVEGALLGLLGGGAGLILGGLLGLGFNALGVAWQPPGAVADVTLTVALTLRQAGSSFLAAILATVLSALYPALRTSRIRVVEALRVS